MLRSKTNEEKAQFISVVMAKARDKALAGSRSIDVGYWKCRMCNHVHSVSTCGQAPAIDIKNSLGAPSFVSYCPVMSKICHVMPEWIHEGQDELVELEESKN
jgi:hypothetical protein